MNKSASNSDFIDLSEARKTTPSKANGAGGGGGAAAAAGGAGAAGEAGGAGGAGGAGPAVSRLASSVTVAVAGVSRVGRATIPPRSLGSVGLLQDTNLGGAMGGAGLLSTAGGPGKPRGIGPKAWLKMDEQGICTPVTIDKHRLSSLLRVPMRDLRMLEPNFSNSYSVGGWTS
jgi:hypothetical protein